MESADWGRGLGARVWGGLFGKETMVQKEKAQKKIRTNNKIKIKIRC